VPDLTAQIDLQVEEGVETSVSRLWTSCKTKFCVIQQNRKYLLEFHFRLGKPTDYNFRPGKLPEYYIRTGTKTSRLLQLDRKSTPDFRSIPIIQTGYSYQTYGKAVLLSNEVKVTRYFT